MFLCFPATMASDVPRLANVCVHTVGIVCSDDESANSAQAVQAGWGGVGWVDDQWEVSQKGTGWGQVIAMGGREVVR